MPSVAEPNSPDLSPWEHALSGRVQPVVSALFHDVMAPLSLLKNRTYLIRNQLQKLHDDPSIADDVRAKLAGVMTLLDVLDEAAHRIHRGVAVPRDAIWAAVLEEEPFHPERVVNDIGIAMRGSARPAASPPDPPVAHTY